MKLDYFENLDNFYTGLQSLFKSLNLPVNYLDEKSLKPQDVLSKTYKESSSSFLLMDDVYILGMVDDAAFANEKSEEILKVKNAEKDYDGILIFGVTLKEREKGLLPTRAQLAEITRAFNREFHYSPVVIVFRYENFISLANANRLRYKQEWREGEKPGKVSVLRDVDITNPHTGHLKILEELKITRSGKTSINSFNALYRYWQEVFSVSLLNKKFYSEISNWYFWAIKNVTFPSEPTIQSLFAETGSNDTGKLEALKQEHKAKNVIRLLTRLLFVWFIKEKKLIPEELFDLDALQKDILVKIEPYHEEGLFKEENRESTYYKAILQNLFFATLNCPIKPDSADNRERGFRGDESYGKHRGVDYLMRHKKHFKDPEAFLNMVNAVVPFLNGGLFECLDDKENNTYIDGFSDNMAKGNSLVVPDYLFFCREETTDLSSDYGEKITGTKDAVVKGLINILKSYKFTIAENTPIEEDVALDPELLGKVFENLLASYNPETKTTARKQTGSFYTPREIVNYMVDESLIAHLKNSVSDWDREGKELDDQLRKLVSFNAINPFESNDEVSKKIIHALDTCKILDPACGSGAFPMGILQKMVHILQKVDPHNEYWQDLQHNKAIKETEGVFEIKDKEERDQLLLEINEAFDETLNNPDYARKLFLVENCIYGVDIQPIAAQISKLRFFISLVVEQKVNPEKENFGIRPLPNLETKFVTANTLIGIEKPDTMARLFEAKNIQILESELKNIRHLIFALKSPSRKKHWKGEDKRVRTELAELLEEKLNAEMESSIKNDKQCDEIKYFKELINRGVKKDSYLKEIEIREQALEKLRNNFKSSNHETAQQLADWDPYDQNGVSPFFDSEWMFDIKDGFDVVIGNPPYVQIQKFSGQQCQEDWKKQNYKTFVKTGDIYSLFYEKGNMVLRSGGVLAFITSNKWMRANYGKATRKYFLDNSNIQQIIDFGDSPIFENATTYTNILIMSKEQNKNRIQAWDLSKEYKSDKTLESMLEENASCESLFNEDSFVIIPTEQAAIKKRIEEIGTPLKDWDVSINYGIKTGFNEAFIINGAKKDELIAKDPKSAEIIKPILRGRDIKRYKVNFADLWLINSHNGYFDPNTQKRVLPIIIDAFPVVKEYLNSFLEKIEKRQDKGITPHNLRNCAYLKEFEKKRIAWPETAVNNQFTIVEPGYMQDKTSFFMATTSAFLLAVLNSPISCFFFDLLVSKMRGGYFSMSKIYVEQIPIPKIPKLQQLPYEILVECIHFAKENNLEMESKTFESVIDGMVYDLYFEEEMKKEHCYITDKVSEVIKPFGSNDNDEFKTEYTKKLHNFFRNDKTVFHGLIHRRNVKVVEIINGDKNE